MVSVRLVKKHKTAGLVPNGLAITTDAGRKVNTCISRSASQTLSLISGNKQRCAGWKQSGVPGCFPCRQRR